MPLDDRPPLNEADRRLPTWKPGVAITLCDGQEWTFPSPRLRFTPTFNGDGRLHFTDRRAALGPDIAPIIDRIVEATDGDILESAAELAVFALRQNYDIREDEWASLLYFETDNDENMAVWRSIAAFARGDIERPKVSAVGSGEPSEPTTSTPTD